MEVREIATSDNGSAAQQFIEVEDEFNEAFSSPPYKLLAYQANGNFIAQHVFSHPGTVGPAVDESDPILVATTAWQAAHPAVPPQETLPDNFLPTDAGQVCFTFGGSDTKIDCVTYGCVTAPVSPSVAGPAPADGESAQRQGFNSSTIHPGTPTPKAANIAGTAERACPPAPPTFVTGPEEGEMITNNRASFYVLEAESGGSLQCYINSPSFFNCSHPFMVSLLPEGSNSLGARQLDDAMTEGLPAIRNFTVDVEGPPADITIVDDEYLPDGDTQTGATRKPLGSSFTWKWGADGLGTPHSHNVVQNRNLFSSGAAVQTSPPFSTDPSAGTYGYYCTRHGNSGVAGTVEVIPVRDTTPEPAGLPFRVAWDTGATSTAANKFDVRYSVNNGPYKTWLDDTKKADAVFGRSNKPVKVKEPNLYEFRVRSQKSRRAKSGFSPLLPVRP